MIGFEVSDKATAEDFRDVVLPAFERASKDGEFRAIIVIPEFKGMSAGGLWEDLKIGVEHLRGWKRIAVVTDIDWIIHVTRMFGWMTPGDVRTFRLNQRDDAIAWAAGSVGGVLDLGKLIEKTTKELGSDASDEAVTAKVVDFIESLDEVDKADVIDQIVKGTDSAELTQLRKALAKNEGTTN
ncbi:MAG TPA: STAS/SEC14 domain-containing protein [Acidimicrobiales bacterium]|nr:STAS/SEC14 domain-containing protein [Acidimicrobiales bacterium]